MDIKRAIDDIEQLEEMFEAPDSPILDHSAQATSLLHR
jgi:hypothetical protein